MEWPTLGKRAAPTEQPAKKQRRRKMRHWNFKLHLLLDKFPTADMDKRLEAFFIPKWMIAYQEKFGNLQSIPNGPVTGPQRFHIWEATVRLSKKFLYWRRGGGCTSPPITCQLMQPLLGKEILLNYTNKGGRSTEMYPKVVKAVFAYSAQLADPDGKTAFTISFFGINAILLEASWTAPNPEYREDHRLRCYVCGQFTPEHGFCGCRD